MLREDDRAQSLQIGAILLFGILIIGLSIFQTVVVPQENGRVEFNGYAETTEDLVTFRNDILTAGTQGGQQAESLKTGVRYPPRAVLINPGPPVGSVGTTPAENVTISGVVAVSGEPRNVQGVWNTSERGAQNYSTRSLVFTPAYNEITVPSVELSGDGAYRLTGNGPLALTERRAIVGNTITLVTVDGDLRTGSLTSSVAASPASVATRSVTVTGDRGADFTVTLPVPGNDTEAAAQAWNDSAAATTLDRNPNVVSREVNGSRVDVTLDGSRTYTLRLARVVVHDKADSGVDTDTDPQYLVPLTSNGTEVATSGSRDVTVEVRDRYNNPLGGVDVDFTANGGDIDGSSTVTTDADGTATVAFNISDGTDTANVTAEIVDEGVAPYNSTTIAVIRQGAGGDDGGDGGGINPAGGNDLVLQSATLVDSNGNPTQNDNKIDAVWLSFKNFDSSREKNITRAKLSFYSVDAQSGSRDPSPDSATLGLVGSGSTVSLNTGGDFENTSYVFSPSQTRTFEMEFYENTNAGGSEFTPQRGDFYVLNVFIDIDGDGTGDASATYFIAPR
ncbi:Ig-like domain-containing protein [Salinigranum sp.]|uniref:Ig-like domain-containing protein n=1 Tax=Salinigranum sp. TaxID=1966351 RepID=UPI0035627CE0